MDLTSKQTKKIKFTKPLGSGQQKNKELMKAYLSRFFHENCFYMIIILFFYVVICSRLLLNPQKLLSSLDLLRKITRINFSII